ncbi:MAG: hypothetical protein EPO39_17740 [Candidatus Manganitrophaceae bacterium]|nr:MAG: hypothetical protein EPO39_17740 [Candidatus Manganitrophaceae bacterium]
MSKAFEPPPDPSKEEPIQKKSHAIRGTLIQEGLFKPEGATAAGNDLWRIATEPYWITKEELDFLETLGNQLLSFYQAANRLYLDSVHGKVPHWVADYLDQGKPETVVEYGRMNRFKQDLPGIIRPDLIPTEEGMIATELDAVPGGMGLTAGLSVVYAGQGELPVGSTDGMVAGFEWMIRSQAAEENPLLAIIVSDESKDYRPEMEWLGRALNRRGLRTRVLHPREVHFTEEGLWADMEGKRERIDILYRFFELFDLKNIPKSELILYAAKKKLVALTPPPKAFLEEKSLFALFHHPVLKEFWLRHLGEATVAQLRRIFPKTWIIDPREVPPHAIIPDLTLEGQPVTDFRQLGGATQKERQLIIKPSGFSELAWGSRGVVAGHDHPEEEWKGAIDRALQSFPTTPYILQKFHKGRKGMVRYYDFEGERVVSMEGRARLSPYYFVDGKEAKLGGILATVVSTEKKLIHGMVDAVIAPCAVAP